MSEEPEAKITLTGLSRPETTPVEPAAQANPVNTVMQDPDIVILRCTNPVEAITYEKKLRRLAETAMKKFQEVPNAEDEGQEAAPEAQVIWEEVAQQDPEDVMHSLDEMLSDDQVRLLEKLLHSHACMLEL